ncbi:MAG: ABC transporter substrate-binding protein [Litorilinea sp.]
MRKLLPISVLVLVFALMAACAPAAPAPADDTGMDDAPMAEGGMAEGGETLRFGIDAADLGNLDPHYATSTPDRTVVSMVFNGLVRYAPGEAPALEPDLATAIPEPTMDGEQQVWTFELREGVMCHAGPNTDAYELTSADVVYSLNKAANADTSAFAGEYAGMSFAAIDDYTVEVRVETPVSPVLFLPKFADYAGGFVVCAQAYEAMADDVVTHPVGTGPFMFQSYTPQDRVVLTANADYWRGAPALASVELRYMPDISSRELGLRAGELDVIDGLDEAQWIESTDAEEALAVDVFGVGELLTIHFNMSIPPMDDPLVRQAIAYAVDREEFQALFGDRVATISYSPVPHQLMDGGLTLEETQELGLDYSYNVERAQELLAEAGYADGFAIEVVTSEMRAYRAPYESLQAQLSQVGIDMSVQVVDHASMHSQIRLNTNPIVLYVAYRPNADAYLTRFFHSDSSVSTGASPDTNFSHYDQIDDLIEEARAETDAERQIELWREAQVQILEDMASHTLLYQNQVYARSTSVDYGHPLVNVLNLNPQITEQTTITR